MAANDNTQSNNQNELSTEGKWLYPLSTINDLFMFIKGSDFL
jgi:hypothetical protein